MHEFRFSFRFNRQSKIPGPTKINVIYWKKSFCCVYVQLSVVGYTFYNSPYRR